MKSCIAPPAGLAHCRRPSALLCQPTARPGGSRSARAAIANVRTRGCSQIKRGLCVPRFRPDGQPDAPAAETDPVRHVHNMTTFDCDVAIIGGGLGGLAVAAGLRHRGWDAHVYEAAPALRTASGTLISLGPNAMSALGAIEPKIVPRIKETGVVRQYVHLHVRTSKDSEPNHTRHASPPGTWAFRWSEVQRVLSELVPAEAVHCDHKGIGYTEHQDGVAVHFKDKPDVTARMVVVADGVRSAMRAKMLPADPGPRFLGQMNWSAISHNPGLVDVCDLGEGVAYCNHSGFNDATLQFLAIPLPGDLLFWQVCLWSDQPSFTAQQATHPTGQASSGSNLVGGGMGCPGSKARLVRLLEEAGFDTPVKVAQAMPESDIFERAVLDRLPLDELGAARMYSAAGRVVLLGDAAHAMHTGPGQGARAAFEDADTLIRHLETARLDLATAGWKLSSSEAAAAQNPKEMGDDGELLLSVAHRYDADRRIRTCRVQRFAQESSGLRQLREAAKPPGVTDAQHVERIAALYKWLNHYPDNLTGEPGNPWWPPVEQTDDQAVEVLPDTSRS